MLLAADVGNTEIVLGVFRGAELAHTWRISTQAERTADELALLFSGFLAQADMSFESQVTGLVVASVVPDVTAAMREMASRYFPVPPVIVGPGTKTGVPILTDNPREVGADRVVNALAAFSRFGGPAIVVDFGTATNFDVVSDKGEFIGGVIAPGMQASAASLFSRTARLTRVELTAPASVIGKSTVECIQSGLIYGTAGEVDAHRRTHHRRAGEGDRHRDRRARPRRDPALPHDRAPRTVAHAGGTPSGLRAERRDRR